MLRHENKRWIWYASQSERPVHLDAKRYPSVEFDGRLLPRPEWVCQADNGGLHVDARVGRIDVNVASRPISTMELNWTEPYALNVVARNWVDLWRDLIDPDQVFLGALLLDGRGIQEWVSIHGIRQPALKSKKMTERRCSHCGNLSTWTQGGEFFDASHLPDQMVLVNANGIFLREDVVRERGIRAPKGSSEPSYVVWKAPT